MHYGCLNNALPMALVLVLASSSALAANTPCSGKKGGIAHCDNGRFICKDGSVSQSKKVCGEPGSKKRR